MNTALIITIALALCAVIGMGAFFFLRLLRSMEREFKLLAENTAAKGAKELAGENAAVLKGLLAGFSSDFKALKDANEAARRENLLLGNTLKEKIDDVTNRALTLGKQADDFISALKGGHKVQGNWGEGILTRVLEDAGLEEGRNFILQSGSSDTGRPDVTLMDGTSRRIFIDAKVNISCYIDSVNAARSGDEEESARLLKEHARRVRAQITSLCEKNYPGRISKEEKEAGIFYAPFVIMFMPSEATYSAAIAADPGLVAFANAHNVLLSSPQMLFGYLVLFKFAFDRVQIDKNNAAIAARTKLLLERLEAAFAQFDDVASHLDKAVEAFHGSMKRLGKEEGGMNILAPAKDLIRLAGYRAKKSTVLTDEQP